MKDQVEIFRGKVLVILSFFYKPWSSMIVRMQYIYKISCKPKFSLKVALQYFIFWMKMDAISSKLFFINIHFEWEWGLQYLHLAWVYMMASIQSWATLTPLGHYFFSRIFLTVFKKNILILFFMSFIILS